MRVAKVLLAVVAVFLVLLIGAVAIFASTFDPNDYKGLVTEQFAARTGRTLAIEEDLRLAYFPWLAVETGGITVGNAEAFGGAAQPFAAARRVAARVKLLPLLSRRVEIGTVVLDGLTLNLARDAEQRGNWEDLLPAGDSAPPAAADNGGPALDSLAIEGVSVTDGNVYWRDNSPDPRYSVTGLSLSTGGIGSNEPVEFEAALRFTDHSSGLTAALAASAVAAVAPSGSVAATDVEASATIDAGNGAPTRTVALSTARLAFDREAENLATEGLVTEIDGIRATWQLAASGVIANPTVTGSVAVDRADVAAVFAQLGLSAPASLDPRDLGSFTLSTQFSFKTEPQTATWSELTAEVLGMRIASAGSLNGNELAGNVAIAEFTPNAALQAVLRTAVPPTVDVSTLGPLALDTRFDTSLDTRRAALRGFTLRALGGTFSGSLEAVPGPRGNVFRGELTAPRFPADAIAAAFAALLPPDLSAAELGTLALEARFELDQQSDTLTVAPLAAEAFGLRASGELTGRGVSTAAHWTGTASVAQFSPQDLLVRFGLPPQPTSDAQALTRATLNTRFDVTNDAARLDGLVLALDDTTIKGTFTLQDFAAPAYRFALEVDAVDADRYLPPKARDAEQGEQTAGDLELPQNNTMNLDGTMTVGSLTLAGLEFANVGSRIVIGGGDMTLENARADLYGGTFNGSFHVRAAGNEPGLALTGQANGIALEPLIAALTASEPNVSGTGSFDLELAGQGRTVIQNVATAGGNVRFDMVNGAIKGFNLGRTLCSLYNVTQRAPAPPEQPEVTAFEAIKGSAVVAAGTATSNDLLARTSFMDLNGAGTLALVEQQLDYTLDARLTGPIGIPNCETMDQFVGDALPFRISGTVTSPTITPDFSKLVQRQIREEVRERLQERIQDRLRDILR